MMESPNEDLLYETPLQFDFILLQHETPWSPPLPPRNITRNSSMDNLLDIKKDTKQIFLQTPSLPLQRKSLADCVMCSNQFSTKNNELKTVHNCSAPSIQVKNIIENNGDQTYIESKVNKIQLQKPPVKVKPLAQVIPNLEFKASPPKLPQSSPKHFHNNNTCHNMFAQASSNLQSAPRKSLPNLSLSSFNIFPSQDDLQNEALHEQSKLLKQGEMKSTQHVQSSEVPEKTKLPTDFKRHDTFRGKRVNLEDIPLDIVWEDLTVEDISDVLSLLRLNIEHIKVFMNLGIDGERLKQMSEKMLRIEPFSLNEFYAQQIYIFINGWRPKHSKKMINTDSTEIEFSKF